MQVSLPTDDVCDKVEYMEQLCKGLQKRITEILLMTQSMVHCVQYLYKNFIFNPFITQGVEFLLTFAFKACLV